MTKVEQSSRVNMKYADHKAHVDQLVKLPADPHKTVEQKCCWALNDSHFRHKLHLATGVDLPVRNKVRLVFMGKDCLSKLELTTNFTTVLQLNAKLLFCFFMKCHLLQNCDFITKQLYNFVLWIATFCPKNIDFTKQNCFWQKNRDFGRISVGRN